ncbi:type II toxin-antitoxin system VapB family antitoxin [Brevundimonas subvibrioides]|uniref:type II toxin-antitoxin system VapB family antitoxin n=1 Tax=Brevundimonas subvibrioides TaxID=74313 RepID=UPI0022B3CE66|nr:CopG family transcriptional regulator [Brevundimonas subvibrioides]
MRTTLTIDDDLLERARAIADYENRSIGEVVSERLRKSFEAPASSTDMWNGFPQLPRRGAVVTMAMVNASRDEED